ncbi:hypothetical protein HEP87_56745 [Streptomyces sp. S1D4-11]
MDCAWDAGDEHRGVVAGVQMQVPPAVDLGHVRGGGLDDVGPPLVSEHDERDRVEVVLGRVVDPGDVQAVMGDEAAFGRVVSAGGPELFDRVPTAVVAFTGLDLVQGRGGHAAPSWSLAAARGRAASFSGPLLGVFSTRGRWT